MRVSNTIAILLSTAAAASTIAAAAAFVPTFSYTKYATTTTRRVPSPQLLPRYNKLHELLAAVAASAPSSSISSSDIIDNITIRDEINAMRMADIKKELESYGIDSKAYFEKRELVEALVDARRSVGIMGIDGYYDDTTADSFDTVSADTTTIFGNEVGGSFATDYGEAVDSASSSSSSSSSPSNNTKKKKDDEKKSWFKPLEEMADKFTSTLKDGVSKVDTNNTRKGRIKVEQTKLKDSSMSVKEMRNELESLYGISTKSYFEKSEFVKALAEARVDGMKKKKKKSSTVSSSTSSSSASSSAQSSSSSSSRSHNTDEQWDTSYKNVYTRRFDASTIDPRGVIDVSARY